MNTAKPHQPRPEQRPGRVLICARCGGSRTTLHKMVVPGQRNDPKTHNIYVCFPDCTTAHDRQAIKQIKLKRGLTKKRDRGFSR